MYYDKLASELDNLLENFGNEIDTRLENISSEEFKDSILKSEEKLNEEYFKTKLRAIENICFMLINNDDAILRTEKFIESILTKKR